MYNTGWWFHTFFIFPYFVGMMIQSDELIFIRGVGQPPTRICSMRWVCSKIEDIARISAPSSVLNVLNGESEAGNHGDKCGRF